MFTSFNTGAERPAEWEDAPVYAPGRFHAHAISSSGHTPSASRASSVHNLPFDPTPAKASRSRPRSRARFQPLFRTDEAQDSDGVGSPLLGTFFRPLGGFASLGGGGGAIEERDEDDDEGHGWLRPGRRKVESVMDSWWKRWAVLVGAPCLMIWIWCSIPFPVQDPYREEPPWHLPWPPTTDPPGNSTLSRIIAHLPWLPHHQTNAEPILEGWPVEPGQQVLELQYTQPASGARHADVDIPPSQPGQGDGEDDLPVDANFYYFLFVYYGVYLAIGLIFITKLFDLYRLNWWPSSLGGSVSYLAFWSFSVTIGFTLHYLDLDGFGRRTRSRRPRPSDEWDWERKTTWVLLAFATMSFPALACFAKLRKDRRNTNRRNLTAAQKTFLERQLTQRMPRSYRRFLWFIANLGLSLLALIVGQGFATVYLSTLPHSNIEGLVYVYTWILTTSVFNGISSWILQKKVRSQALVFVFRFYFFLSYFVFYRNLFARLRSPDQAVWITLLSSSVVVVIYPISMSRLFWRFLRWSTGLDLEWEDYAAEKGRELYLRNLSEVVTMIAFVGWLSILHWGPNQAVYPFFAFDSPEDPYTYRLTLTASLIIFAAELFSSWIARGMCWLLYGIDVTNLGLDTFREHPELVIACVFTSAHVLSDMLLFLIRLNFR
ncbi:hypothetical protein JCM10207_001932 [Rhodosporidiobolus poonsookiae]